ncbi:MAG TPA: phosphoglucosamine mutase [Lentimicrobium sp.]|nr:phosphoglucosamine mutase [Lentimicrobium sp.]
MTLIKSISGIRGTIGGQPGESLTPIDIVKFASAYAQMLKSEYPERIKIVVGRDARISGPMVSDLVCSTLVGSGVNVVDVGLSTTPTVEMAVVDLNAHGGIIITASHNPWQWNALKLLDKSGEFINDLTGKRLLEIAETANFSYAEIEQLGTLTKDDSQIRKHIEKIISLPYIDAYAIRSAKLKVAVDAVNSTGGIAIPLLLKSLGVDQIQELYCEPTGYFPHNPEPLPENLTEISKHVVKTNAHVGFVVDPDVDRLAIICEDGEMFGEEYTLVAVADYILSMKPGNTVSNMSSTRALRDITEKAGQQYAASAVGEVNVVKKMKEINAVIGGEGNGGVILPELHYGRDALVGIALFLSYLAKSGKRCSSLRAGYPNYFISKNKIQLMPEMDVDAILDSIAEKYKRQQVSRVDGVKIDFQNEWVHLRKSNTEPIIRIYSESDSESKAESIARKIIDDIRDVIRKQ